MPTNRYPIRTPTSAEVSAGRLVRRIRRRAVAAMIAHVRDRWPDVTSAAVARAALATLDRRATLAALTRIGLLLQRGIDRDLRKLTPDLPPWSERAERARAATWAKEVLAAIVFGLVGGRADSVDARYDAPKSALASFMSSQWARRKTHAEVIQALDEYRLTAAESEQGEISRVRARVVRWAADRNQERQREIGVKRYTWRTKRDPRVRPGHARLDDTVQRWSKKPYVGSGRYAHPGEDYNCRCIAIPIATKKTKGKLGVEEEP